MTAAMARMHVTLLLLAICSASAATPIEKVVQLLKDLQVKVEKQGAKEAAQYDKYSCFCKNQAEFKNKAIDKSKDKIKVFDADISDLDAMIKGLNSDISDLGKEIDVLETDIKTATDKRDKAHEKYLVKAKDLNEAIDSCVEAVEALKGTKKEMTGDAKLNLAQLKQAASKVKQTPDAMQEALSLVKQAQKDAETVSVTAEKPAVSFQYQSNDIIATIEDLQATFKSMKKTLDFEEFEAKDDSNKAVLGYTNDKAFKEKDKKQKEVLSEEKTEEKQETEQSKDEEDANQKSDEAFLAALTSSCEQKAKDWDQRSKARSEEMTALAEATETLENGALKQYNVNKKLTGLVALAPKAPVTKVAPPAPKQEPTKKADASKKEAKAVPSFLQVRSVGSAQAAAVQRMLAKLDTDASRLRSPILAAIALKAQMKEDHFTNVRALIKDLISKLKSDAKAESTTKNFCDVEMKKAVDNRDTAADNIEEQNGIIAKKSALADAKAEEIEDLSEDIAKLNKEILEAEELRKSEKSNNEQAIAEAKAGTAAVKSALTVLKGFYGLVQTNYKPPKSDRFGNTVDDVAPESFSGEYKGAGDSAKGILGVLEVIQSDFERTETETKKEEKKAAEDHTKFMTESKADIKTKSQSKIDAAKAKEAAEQAVVQANDDLYDAKTLRASAEAELEKLSPMCVEGDETYAERVQKRMDEIAALKEAYKILDDWQN